MDPTIILEIINGALDIINEIPKQLPTYDQRLRKKLYNLQMDLFKETNKSYGNLPESRDDAKVMNILNDINLMLKISKKELGLES